MRTAQNYKLSGLNLLMPVIIIIIAVWFLLTLLRNGLGFEFLAKRESTRILGATICSFLFVLAKSLTAPRIEYFESKLLLHKLSNASVCHRCKFLVTLYLFPCD
jgi:uncharacterized membrane protein